MIKLKNLETFLSSPASQHQQWARALFILGCAMDRIPGIEVRGVAPDFDVWNVHFCTPISAETRIIGLLQQALLRGGSRREACYIDAKQKVVDRRAKVRSLTLSVSALNAERVAIQILRIADGQPTVQTAYGRPIHSATSATPFFALDPEV